MWGSVLKDSGVALSCQSYELTYACAFSRTPPGRALSFKASRGLCGVWGREPEGRRWSLELAAGQQLRVLSAEGAQLSVLSGLWAQLLGGSRKDLCGGFVFSTALN